PSLLDRALRFAERHHVLVLAAAGGFAVVGLILLASLALAMRSAPALRISLAGVTLEGDELEARHEAAARAYLARPFTITLPGSDEKLELRKDELGVTLDRRKLGFQLEEL